MGEEILTSQFSEEDYQNYAQHLLAETQRLKQQFEDNDFCVDQAVGGLEQEAWLIAQDATPSPDNALLLNELPKEVIAPELSRFNFELNVCPQLLSGKGLMRMHQELEQHWQECAQIADRQNDRILMVGILATLQDDDLTLENMSPLNRYRALNEQVMLARKGKPLHLDINGREHLISRHNDVMLESAATSFQLHRQIPARASKRYLNAATIASAATVALGANSPFLFGRSLWEETRIPLFESSVESGGYGDAASGPIKRVGFGSGYVQHSVFECFQENLNHFPILLPVKLDDDAARLPYLRLHNGTIWRWNRPLIGFEKNGQTHLRIEHRVIAAGPTIVDEMANAAFFYGLQETLANSDIAPETLLPFSVARDNFYEAARLGLRATNQWLDGKRGSLKNLILDRLLEDAMQGLRVLQVDEQDSRFYLDIIRARAESGMTGAQWQREFVEKRSADMVALTHAYYQAQNSGKPVHEWLV
ncbi:MAG: glutamate--cysteine ligase [Gammaproteobacteria bacterium]|nr:glutamate--cysteine ligase [Gammaproteobacteria bacterium]